MDGPFPEIDPDPNPLPACPSDPGTMASLAPLVIAYRDAVAAVRRLERGGPCLDAMMDTAVRAVHDTESALVVRMAALGAFAVVCREAGVLVAVRPCGGCHDWGVVILPLFAVAGLDAGKGGAT